jgi:hypothetical protein
MKNNKIKIAGVIKDKPQLILDASEYERRRYETKLVAERKSGTEDVLILQFDGSAMQEEDFEKLEVGTCVNVTGEIRTENVREIIPTAPTVKIFIAAGKVQIVEAITEKQNVVKLCGHICKDPRARGTSKGIHITDIMIAVKGKKNVSFIPCICWQNVADAAGKLKKGTYVEAEGRFQSREYKKAIEGSAPYLMTAYEVSVVQLGVAEDDAEQEDE